MKGTFDVPSGRRLRVSSQRRYVVVMDNPDFRPGITYRTDDLERARASARRHPRTLVILDTSTGKVVQ